MDRNIDPRKFIKGETKRVIVAADETLSAPAAIWNKEYAFFKITCIDTGDIAPGTTVYLLSGEKHIFLNGSELSVTPTSFDGGFMWLVTALCGLDNILIELDAAVTADTQFQITPYEEAQTT